MNIRTTLFLAVLAAILAGYLAFSGRRAPPGPVASPVAFDPTSVSMVGLVRSNLTVRVERIDGRWILKRPVEAIAQSTGVENLLQALSTLDVRSLLQPNEVALTPESLQSIGLDTKANRITVQSMSGTTQLKIGNLAPVGSQFYFQVVGKPGLYTADASFLKTLPVSANEWRDRAMVDLRETEFDRIEVRGQAGFEAAKERGTDEWHLTKPLSARADRARLETVLAQVRGTRVTEFVADAPVADPETYGLQPPQLELIVGRGSNDLVRLQFGRSVVNAPDEVFVRNLARTNILRVPSDLLLTLKQPLANFRDRQLLPQLTDVSEFEFRVASEHVVARREGTNWWVTTPTRFKADSGVVNYALFEFQRLSILDFPADVVPKPELFGLQKPVRQYWFRRGVSNGNSTTNENVVELAFGSLAGQTGVYARRSDESGVYTVPQVLASFPETANQLRDWKFDASDAVEILITQTNATRRLTRNESGGWHDQASAGSTIASEAIDEILFRLSQLRSARYPIRNERLILDQGGFVRRAHEIIFNFRPGADTFRRWRLRFGGDIADMVVTLANFDDDPVTLRIAIPANLYGDIYHYLNAILE